MQKQTISQINLARHFACLWNAVAAEEYSTLFGRPLVANVWDDRSDETRVTIGASDYFLIRKKGRKIGVKFFLSYALESPVQALLEIMKEVYSVEV